jgi:hypothetical protein
LIGLYFHFDVLYIKQVNPTCQPALLRPFCWLPLRSLTHNQSYINIIPLIKQPRWEGLPAAKAVSYKVYYVKYPHKPTTHSPGAWLILAGVDPVTLRILVTKPQKKVSKNKRASHWPGPVKKQGCYRALQPAGRRVLAFLPQLAYQVAFFFCRFFLLRNGFQLKKEKHMNGPGLKPGLSHQKSPRAGSVKVPARDPPAGGLDLD